MFQQPPSLNLAPGTPSSINDLPFEILSWILQLGMEATPSYELHQYIARVSSVSRYWRDVATQTTDLWTILDPKQPLPVLNTYIHRSGQAPLILATYHDAVLDELVVLPVDRANAILAHASRIIDLDLAMKRTDYPAIVSSLSQLSNSAESLSLSLVEDDDDITTGDDEEEEEEAYSPPILPGNIFGGNQPHNFCELSLSGCRIDWTSPLLHHLVKLCLDSQVQPTWQTLYDVLSQQTELEILRLDGCLPLPDPTSGDLIPCIPTLSELTIIDDYDNCLWFLRHIQVQVSYLYFDCDAMGANSGHELMSTCVEILQDTCSGNPLTDLEIITETIDGVNLRLAGHQRNPNSGDVTKFDVAFIYEAGTPLHQHITQLLQVITTNKIAKIISLECDFHPGSSLSFWLAVHEAVFMPDLVELKLMSTSALTTYMDACLVMMKRYQDWTGTVSSLRPLPQAQQVFAEWGCLPSCYYSICTDVSRLAAIPAQPLVPDDFDISKEYEDVSVV
ncbi:hypothetical protein ONZ45_g10807 [Pleurotus djamor]|nr:hypothetical protein ONZ45_g10807 [Pleurotus djamor]